MHEERTNIWQMHLKFIHLLKSFKLFNFEDIIPCEIKHRVCGVMVSVLATSVSDRDFEPRTGQTNDFARNKNKD